MDYLTKWPEAYHLKNSTANAVVDCLVDLTAWVRLPEEPLSDYGPNFISMTVLKFCVTVGIGRIRTSPYHPQTDGMVERFNSTLKRLVRKLTQKPGTEWDMCSPFVLWAYPWSLRSRLLRTISNLKPKNKSDHSSGYVDTIRRSYQTSPLSPTLWRNLPEKIGIVWVKADLLYWEGRFPSQSSGFTILASKQAVL